MRLFVKKSVAMEIFKSLNKDKLEKSISGEWIEKAGYAVGTVRILCDYPPKMI